MKNKLLLLIAILTSCSRLAAANTQTPAANISTNCSTWNKNLNCGMTNQQLVDNAVDQLSSGGGGSSLWVELPGNIGINTTQNVGIGSVNPKGSLDVGSTGSICLGNVCNTSWPKNGFWIQSPGNVGINTTQSVSIGTTSVDIELSVAGSRSTNPPVGVEIQNNDPSGAGALFITDNTGLGSGPAAYIGYDNSRATALIGAGKGDLQIHASNDQYIDFNASGNVGIGTTDQQGAFVVMTGNVGINALVPNAMLEITQNSNATMKANGQYFSKAYDAGNMNSGSNDLDWNNANVQHLLLRNGGGTLILHNPSDGGRYLLMIRQPAAGAEGLITWPVNVEWPSGAAPVLTTTNNQLDIITMVYDGANSVYYASTSLNYT